MNRVNIVSNICLSPGRRQTIIWTNVGILLIRPFVTSFNSLMKNASENIVCEMAAILWRGIWVNVSWLPGVPRLPDQQFRSAGLIGSNQTVNCSQGAAGDLGVGDSFYKAITVMWAGGLRHLTSLATQLLIQQVNVHNKEFIKSLHYWPFVRGIHLWLVASPHKGPIMQKTFPCHDVFIHMCWTSCIRCWLSFMT